MSDDVDLTGGSWRTPRVRAPMDPQMKQMGLIAACIVGAIVLGLGAWSVVGRRPHVVPVIEADSRPIRVKPDNPGGMQIAGAEEAIMGGPGTGQADAMAPPAEAPAPQALRAQIKAATQPPPAHPAPQMAAGPLAATPPPAPAAVPDAHPARAAPARPAMSGLQVQLAALESKQAAETEWQRLAKRMPDLLGSHQPAVQPTERGGHTLWRLRTSGFADMQAATSFCAQIRTKGAECAIATF